MGNCRIITRLLLTLLLLSCRVGLSQPVDPAVQDEWLRREQRQQQEQQRRDQRPDVHLDVPVPQTEPQSALPQEDFCFQIDRLQLEGELPQGFEWLRWRLGDWQGRCVGQQGLAQLLKALNGDLLERGYVTSRLAFPEQDLSAGTLMLQFFPGYLDQIRLPQNYRGSWRTAFPARHGDVLNLRELEQGLEQIKRLSSQDVQMQIEPSERTGYSNVSVSVTTGRPWNLGITLDDNGGDATGKYQWSAQAGWDNPLGLQDQMQFGLNQSRDYGSLQGTRSANAYYGIPWGWWLFEASYNQFTYHQQVEGAVVDFMSSGEGFDAQLGATRTLARDNRARLDGFMNLVVRRRNSYIDDAEILVQQRRLTELQAGVRDRVYLASGTLNLSLTYRQGVPWFNAEPGLAGDDAPGPEYRIAQASAGLNENFGMWTVPMWVSSQNRIQWSETPLYNLDWFSIGGRYTVRGYNGADSLGGQRGWLSRNELGHTFAGWGRHDLFMALDAGGVDEQDAQSHERGWLAAAVLGVRGQSAKQRWLGAVQYEAFVAHGLWVPTTFEERGTTGGFSLTWNI